MRDWHPAGQGARQRAPICRFLDRSALTRRRTRPIVDAEDFLDEDELEALRAPKQADGIDPDALQYKDGCERCAKELTWIDAAYICSHECTWCPECADGFGMVCPNCSGELVKRPRRTRPIGG